MDGWIDRYTCRQACLGMDRLIIHMYERGVSTQGRPRIVSSKAD
jgi:hypothetical protein